MTLLESRAEAAGTVTIQAMSIAADLVGPAGKSLRQTVATNRITRIFHCISVLSAQSMSF